MLSNVKWHIKNVYKAIRYEKFHITFGYPGTFGVHSYYYDGPFFHFNLGFFGFGWHWDTWCDGCIICRLKKRK